MDDELGISLTLNERDIKLLTIALRSLFYQLDNDDFSESVRDLLYDDTQRINDILGQLPQVD
jgi:hypothetical protein